MDWKIPKYSLFGYDYGFVVNRNLNGRNVVLFSFLFNCGGSMKSTHEQDEDLVEILGHEIDWTKKNNDKLQSENIGWENTWYTLVSKGN